ncbi:adenosylmethionine decarboxylase [Ophiostoma piceae UAMH 11346]|uniref:Adenosylmethionine decarboxylase n=1 Tax=Ophiostoma piceae (strain UAMH 11346) TaxID=1262450 RepID=S3CQD5_OPHP1|nr:adenosylmethionine decarboxylase [Ophiostoma piceae UAMH 11346]
MVTLDIPNDCTLSPSLATPHLTINHEVAADLDSSNAFEGPEKLLEVWFAPSATSLAPSVKENGLKSVPSDVWVGMLDLVNCKILSVVHSETVDAYLLSESSMFVFPHKIILKTCGTTTLLLGLNRMLRIAATVAGFPFHNALSTDEIQVAATPYRVFYSRKNFLFPDRQQGPHRSWKQEVKYLDDMFEGGSAYMVGKMNGDHWYLYITSPSASTTPPRTPTDDDSSINGFNSGNSTNASSPILRTSKRIPTGIVSGPIADSNELNDETLEILMTDLDPVNAKQFYLEHASAVARDDIVARTNAALRATNNKQAAKDKISHMSDSTYSITGTEELFDVDDIASHSSNGSLTPMSEDHIDIDEALTTEGHALGTVVSDSCGLSDVYPKSAYPDARIDAYMFSPCGFSANGVVPAPAAAETTAATESTETSSETSENAKASMHYFTVHVTPEPNCSFASFETNVPGGQKGRQTADIVKQVVDIFRPGRFSVTLFEAKGKGAPAKDQYFLANDINGVPSPSGVAKPRLENIPGYRRIDRIVHDFEDYDLVFRFYEREGFVSNGEARVGEL